MPRSRTKIEMVVGSTSVKIETLAASDHLAALIAASRAAATIVGTRSSGTQSPTVTSSTLHAVVVLHVVLDRSDESDERRRRVRDASRG